MVTTSPSTAGVLLLVSQLDASVGGGCSCCEIKSVLFTSPGNVARMYIYRTWVGGWGY